MLWQNENGIYSNICIGSGLSGADMEEMYDVMGEYGWATPAEKNNKKSTKNREFGNSCFKAGSWFHAIQYYNRSLLFAEKGTENLSLAYANRSACFLHLKMTDKCLIDIELAVEAGYPEKLRPKLDARKQECMELMEKHDPPMAWKPKLDYEADEKYSEMANVLQIEHSAEYGRMVTAKCDIPAGKVVLNEQAFMMLYMHEKHKKCSLCLKSHTNLVPCEKCTSALFCKDECEGNRFHKYECRLRSVKEEGTNDHQLDILRSVLIAMDIFPNVDELMQFVKETIEDSDPIKIPDKLSDDRSKYRAFLQLWYSEKVSGGPTFGSQAYFAYRMLINQDDISAKFPTLRHKRFLMNLVGHHLCIIQCNTGALIYDAIDDKFGRDFLETQAIIANYINHSCAPNVNIISFDDFKICVTVRPIKKGEQLFLSYFRNDVGRKSYKNDYRQKHLSIMCQIECECERCSLEYLTKSQRNAMKADRLYVEIFQQKGANRQQLMEKCVIFLNKYGGMKWCEEIGEVGEKYIALYARGYRNQPVFLV